LDDLNVVIHGRSFGQRHVDENLASGFAVAEKGVFNIGMLHTSLDGREGHAVYAPCSVGDLRSRGYQYWALGHIHRQEFVSEDPWIVFPGCIQGRHIRETGSKGCVLVTVEDGSVSSVERCPLDVLRWSRCDVDITDVDEMHEVLECVRKGIDQERAASEDRPLAMRIRLQGAAGIAQEIGAYPEKLEQQIRALGAEIAGDELWIERVENLTVSKRDLESALADDNAMSNLLKEIQDISDESDSFAGLKDKIAELRQKVPSEAFGEDSILNLDDAQTIHRIVEEAKSMLIGRLLEVGGEK
jgi:DNA repair exonuclease SbcCD nuclease subunit